LYACPIQQVIIWNDRTINPLLLCCMSLPGAGMLGYASWKLVEKPMLRLARRRRFADPERPARHAAMPPIGAI
jgi:peptidoglycan/LPS O-acetylase OafA/YrhL